MSQNLLDMILVAEEQGTSKRGKWIVECEVTSLNTFTDLGYKKIEDKNKHFTFYHGGQKVAKVLQSGNIYTGTHSYVTYANFDNKRLSNSVNNIISLFHAENDLD